MVGMEKFKEYLKTSFVLQEKLAADLGISQPMISRLKSGAGLPSLKLAIKIERISGGKVPVTSWIPEEKPKKRRGKKS